MLARIYNSLIKAINSDKNHHLARYILIFLDADLIMNANIFDYGVSRTLEDTLKWLLINVNRVIDLGKDDLIGKRPGSVSSSLEPRLIWVSMIPRPESANHHVFTLTRKFNTILEEVITGDRHSHILCPVVERDAHHFDRLGSLTSIGESAYW